jgi:hypothetical protein
MTISTGNITGKPSPGSAPQAGQTSSSPQSQAPSANKANTASTPPHAPTLQETPTPRAPWNAPHTNPVYQHVHPRIGANVLVVALYILIVVCIVAALLAVFLAKSGLVPIPFVSSKLYKGPAVTRTVQAEATNLNAFIDAIGKKLTEVERVSSVPPYRVKITESEFTGALRGSLSDASKNTGVVVERVQAVITPRDIELSGSARKSGLSFNVLARYKPVLREGRLTLEPVSFQIGDFPFATSTVQSVYTYLFTRDIGEWRLEVENRGLTGIELGDGSLNLVFIPK